MSDCDNSSNPEAGAAVGAQQVVAPGGAVPSEEPDQERDAGNMESRDLDATSPVSLPSDVPGEKKMQTLEIDMGNEIDGAQDGSEVDAEFYMDHSFEKRDGDMELLLSAGDPQTKRSGKRQPQFKCSKPEKVGNMVIFFPSVFRAHGWGISGPHWFGPLSVLFLLVWLSSHFIRISMERIGPITTTICILFSLASICNLLNVAYRDPGVVKLQQTQESDEDQRLQFRWCDACECFQPPDGCHCPDCNVCVAGFDQ
jgi:hypothetical protein